MLKRMAGIDAIKLANVAELGHVRHNVRVELRTGIKPHFLMRSRPEEIRQLFIAAPYVQDFHALDPPG